MSKLFRAVLALSVVVSVGCVQRAKGPAPKAAADAPQVKNLTKTDFQRWKLVELMEFDDALEPVWRDTVLQQRDRDRACKEALELDEVATVLSEATLPKEMKAQQVEFEQRVGSLRAAIIVFAAECQGDAAQPLAASFAPIPGAFDAVKQVVEVDETPRVSARLAPPAPASTPVPAGSR